MSMYCPPHFPLFVDDIASNKMRDCILFTWIEVVHLYGVYDFPDSKPDRATNIPGTWAEMAFQMLQGV